jgi:hypothetical protein
MAVFFVQAPQPFEDRFAARVRPVKVNRYFGRTLFGHCASRVKCVPIMIHCPDDFIGHRRERWAPGLLIENQIRDSESVNVPLPLTFALLISGDRWCGDDADSRAHRPRALVDDGLFRINPECPDGRADK